jgi:hypothetical protein
MLLTIIIILAILALAKVIDFSWSALVLILCVVLCIVFLPEILSFLFNLVADVMTAIVEFAF